MIESKPHGLRESTIWSDLMQTSNRKVVKVKDKHW